MAINFPDSPSLNDTHTVNGRTWVWNGDYWKLSGSSNRGISLIISDTPPSDPVQGDMWYESDTGRTFTYYSGAWIELGNSASVETFISDADGDTLIHVESSSDNDTISFTTGATPRYEITSSGHFVPQENEAYDLGTSSNRFRDLYLSGTSIDLGGVSITSDGTNLSLPPISSVSGDFTVGTDTLHVDSTNNRVGVKKTNPSTELDVSGTVTATSFSGPLTGDVTGNSSTSTKLSSARTISLTGDVTGSATFDGSADISISATVGAVDAIPETLIGAKGDLIAGSANDSAARLPVGSNGYFLMADSAATTGLSWKDSGLEYATCYTYLRSYLNPTNNWIKLTNGGVDLKAASTINLDANYRVYLKYQGADRLMACSCGVYVFGALGVSGPKNFVIDHPIDPSKEYIHASIEAPQPDLIYRGISTTDDYGVCEVIIDEYFDIISGTYEAITMNPWAIVSNSNGVVCRWTVTSRGVVVESEPNTEFNWIVIAERSDLMNHYENGRFVTERVKEIDEDPRNNE